MKQAPTETRSEMSDAARLSAAWDAVLTTLGAPPSTVQAEHRAESRVHRERIPVTVLSGFLGAGKTTLLCELLARSPIEIVAVVNDMASINVDAQRVRAMNAETIEFQNGCACCVLGDDLRETLAAIGARDDPPELIVIEASGLADPMGIAQSVGQCAATILDGIVTVVDAQGYRARVSDPVTAHLFKRQLAASHLIVVTKTESEDEISAIQEDVGDLAPGRAVLVAESILRGGPQAVEVILGAATRGARPKPMAEVHAVDGFSVETVAFDGPVGAAGFFALLDEIPDAVYRIKGWLSVSAGEHEPPTRYDVQAAGSRWRAAAQTSGPTSGSLVVIGRAAEDAFTGFVASLRKL